MATDTRASETTGSSSSRRTGVNAPGRARIAARTLRTDRWWRQPILNGGILAVCGLYLAYAVFVNKDYFWEPYISPMYSPCITANCVPGSGWHWLPSIAPVTPALIIILFPAGLRATCYYYRKAYYRAFWAAPPACAVAEPHGKYTGESRFPLILQNIHRYFFYIALAFNVLLTYDAVLAFRNQPGPVGPHGLRDPRSPRQRRTPVALHALLPRLPARGRRPAQALLQASGPVLDVDPGLEAQRPAPADRLGLAGVRGPDRRLRAAGRDAAPSATPDSSERATS